MQENYEPVAKRLKTQEPSFYPQVNPMMFLFRSMIAFLFLETLSFISNAQFSSTNSTIEFLICLSVFVRCE